ncbi:MAG: GLUG motif-containing protein [Sedimentisphaerales bacterium]|jgi:hypothetical protein
MKNTLQSNGIKRVLLAVLVFLIFAMVNPCFAKYSGGTGEPNTPYQIANVADLLTLANDANDYNKCFILTADINLGSSGAFTTAVIGGTFAGVFDGAGHKITNLVIKGSGKSYLGFFWGVSGGEIKNLGIENVSITGSLAVGALAGQNLGTISNCYATGAVTCSSVVGGLVGDNYGNISYCYSAGTINGGTFVGGLVGRHNSGSISNCYSSDAVIGGDHTDRLGGLVGENDGGSISDCHATGSVTGYYFVEYVGGLVGNNAAGSISNSYSSAAVIAEDQCNYFGGLVGVNSGSISSCHAMGMVYSVDEYSNDFGGLVGANSGSIEKCYSMGDVNCGYGSQCLGGLVGYNWTGGNIKNCYSTGNIYSVYTSADLGGFAGVNGGAISNCYATGNVSGYTILGGLVGQNDNSISNCYSTGIVTGSFSCGGLIGRNNSIFSGCYYLITSGPNDGFGTPLTEAQMKLKASFAGWDFSGETANGTNDFWWLCNEGLEYPRLWWQYLPGDIACPGMVGIEDLAVLCEQWLLSEIPADVVPSGGDGIVNFVDFAVFAEQWGITNDINNLLDFAEQWLRVGIARCSADISPWPDGDRVVDFFDFAVMADNWQVCFVDKATIYSPAQDFVSTGRSLTLQWLPGKNYLSHDLYFGTDCNSVSSADTSSAQFMGNQISSTWNTSSYAPAGLDLNTIYYWRVDEVAVECQAKGDVWSFRIAPLGKSANPQPSNGQLNMNRHTVLSWSPATYAASHDIYFDTDYNNVSVATHSSSEYMGSVDVNHWDINNFDANGLGYSTTYYWRIDELKDTQITKGDIWSFTTYSAPDINYGLVDWWDFNEANGLIAHDLVGHNDGNLLGGPVWTTGKIGGGLQFDGTNDYLNCGSGPSNYDNITVSLWMKTTAFGTLVSNCYSSYYYGTWYTLFSTSIQLGGSSTGSEYAYVTFKAATTDGSWHHIVYTKDGTNHAVYVDGSLDRSFTSTADISWSVPFYIGRMSNIYPYFFKGVMDEVRIYNRALNQEEIALLYAQ